MSKSKRNTKKATAKPSNEGPRRVVVSPCNTSEESKKLGVGAVRYVYQKAVKWPTYVTHVVVRLPFQGETIEVDFAVNGHKNSAGKTWTMTGTIERPTLRPLLNWNKVSAELVDGTLTVYKEA